MYVACTGPEKGHHVDDECVLVSNYYCAVDPPQAGAKVQLLTNSGWYCNATFAIHKTRTTSRKPYKQFQSIASEAVDLRLNHLSLRRDLSQCQLVNLCTMIVQHLDILLSTLVAFPPDQCVSDTGRDSYLVLGILP